MNLEARTKSALDHLNQRERDGQLVKGASLWKEVKARKRRLGGGYAQDAKVPTEEDGKHSFEEPFRCIETGKIGEQRQRRSQLRRDSSTRLRAFRSPGRSSRQRLVRLVRGRAAANQAFGVAQRLSRKTADIAVCQPALTGGAR